MNDSASKEHDSGNHETEADRQRRLALTLQELGDSKVDNAGGHGEASDYYAAAAEADQRADQAEAKLIAEARHSLAEAQQAEVKQAEHAKTTESTDPDTQDPLEDPDLTIHE